MSKAFESSAAPRFTRQWWLESAKTGFWVVVVTILIWIYADMEFTQNSEVMLVIRLNTNGSSEFVLVSEPTTEVTYELRGSRTDLDRFAKKFRGSELDYDLSTRSDFQAGADQSIPSVSVLEGLPEVRQWGLRVVSGDPATIGDINVEKLESRELQIEFVFKGAELADGFQPEAAVEVMAPSSHWSDIPAGAKIRTVEKDLTGQPAGKELDVRFQLIPAVGARAVRLKQDSVTVTLKVERRTAPATDTITIPVRISAPAKWAETGVWDEYKLVRKDKIQWSAKITVTGPRKDIDILKTDETKTVDAYITLTDSDTEPIESWLVRKVTLRFPPGLQVQLAPGQVEPTVQFRLEKRTPVIP